MGQIKYFLLGFIFLYIVQIFDIIMNIINSYSAITVTKCQVKIDKMNGDKEISDPYCVGFQYYGEDEDYDMDDYIE